MAKLTIFNGFLVLFLIDQIAFEGAYSICLVNAMLTLPSLMYHASMSAYRHYTIPNNTTLPLGRHDVIVFIHGVDGCAADFLDMRNYLSQRGLSHQMIAVEFGSNNSKISVHDEVRLLRDVLRSQWERIENIWLVGHSKGGVDALQYARCYPEKVVGVVTLSSPVKGSIVADYNPIYPVVRQELGLGSPIVKNLVPEPPPFKLLHIIPTFDHLIQPTENARSDYGEVYRYNGWSWFGFYAHNGVMYDPEIANVVYEFVSHRR